MFPNRLRGKFPRHGRKWREFQVCSPWGLRLGFRVETLRMGSEWDFRSRIRMKVVPTNYQQLSVSIACQLNHNLRLKSEISGETLLLFLKQILTTRITKQKRLKKNISQLFIFLPCIHLVPNMPGSFAQIWNHFVASLRHCYHHWWCHDNHEAQSC